MTGYAVYNFRTSCNRSDDTFDRDCLSTPQGNLTLHEEAKQRFHALWKWGQTRLAQFPTIKEVTQRTLRQVSHQDEATLESENEIVGDFTAMVTAILPFPNLMVSGCTPRGFLRLWDGTGPPICDRYVGLLVC